METQYGTRQGSPSTERRRVSKACEACRQRRRRCDGSRPCSTCVRNGLSDSCHFRIKARPKRFSVHGDGSEDKDMRPDPISQIENLLSSWASAQGMDLDLRLPDETPLTKYMDLPDPALPGDQILWRDLFATFVVKCKHHHGILLPQQGEQVFEHFIRDPGTLKPDAMALVLSILALGRQAESQLRQEEIINIEEEVAFYKLGLSALESCEQASQTGIRALHMLHLCALSFGGPREITMILDAMSQQCRKLGAHRRPTVQLYPPDEQVSRLFYLIMYKDTWFTTLCSTKSLSFPIGEFDRTWADVNDPQDRFRFEEEPLFVDLTLLENEAIRSLQSGPISIEELSELEHRLLVWQKLLRVYQNKGRGMSGYAVIRFHWLRMLLRIPFVTDRKYAFSTLAILSVSSAAILQTYKQLSATKFFWPKWTETRRILTTAYVLLYCTIEGEVALHDFQSSSTTVLELLGRSRTNHPAVIPLIRTWQTLSDLVLPSQTTGEDSYNVQSGVHDNAPFDYTLPPDERQANYDEAEGLTFDYD